MQGRGGGWGGRLLSSNHRGNTGAQQAGLERGQGGTAQPRAKGF